MELDDILSDLISLRKLYALLQTNEDGLQIANSKNLDVKARILLKHLLDDAAVKILETHSKIVAAPGIALNTPCAAQPWQPKLISNLGPPVTPRISENFADAAESHIKCLNPSTDFLLKDKSSTAKLMPQGGVSELSKHTSFITKPALRRKRGWVHDQNNFTNPNPSKEKRLFGERRLGENSNSSSVDLFQLSSSSWADGKEMGSESREKYMDLVKIHDKYSQKQDSKTHQSPSIDKSMRCSSKNPATEAIQSGETVMKAEAVDIPKEAAKAIEQIESRLSSVHLADRTVGMPTLRDQSPNPFLFGQKSFIEEGEKPLESWNHPSPTGNALLGRKHCQKCGKMKSFKLRGQVQSEAPDALLSRNTSWTRSHNLQETMDNIQQMRHSLNQNDDHSLNSGHSVAKGLSFLHAQTGKVNQVPDGTGKKGPNRMAVASQPPIPCSVDSGHIPQRHTKALHRGTIQGSTQLDYHQPSQISTPPIITYKESSAEGSRGSYKHSQMGRQKQIPQGRRVSETSWSSHSSSTWESEARSTSGGSNSEVYSWSSRQSSGSNSESYSDTYSSASEGNDSSSSEVEEHSRSRGRESRLVAPTPRSVAPEKNKRKLSGTSKRADKAEKGIGKLKKFKEKLALIFHHHHHHHHHHPQHRQQEQRRSGDNHSRVGSNRDDIDGDNEVYEERAVDELRRSAVGREAPRRQQGQLQALVGGLVKHVRKSNKSKRNKAGIGRAGNARRHRKLAKKMQWWQKLRPQGGRLKLPGTGKKSHVKWGFKKSKNKKPLLGAVKKKYDTD